MPKYDIDTIPVCSECEAQVGNPVFTATRICLKCHVSYCQHFASLTDLRFCANCISDVKIEVSIIERQVTHERPDGTISFSRKSQAKLIKLMNVDWLFNSTLIENMSDEDIEGSIEYHRANVNLMLQEREGRKLERLNKLRGVKVMVSKPKSDVDLNKPAKSKSKTKIKDVTLEQGMEMLKNLMGSGLTLEQITKMMGGK